MHCRLVRPRSKRIEAPISRIIFAAIRGYIRIHLNFLCLICASMFWSVAYSQNIEAIETRYVRTAHDNLFDIQLIGERGWAVGDHGLLLTTDDGGYSWQTQSVPTEQALLGLDVKSDGRGIIVGQGGLILHSEHAAGGWSKSESGVRSRLFSVSFDNSGFGLTVGEFGTLLSTTDHGKNWSALKPNWTTLLDLEDAPHLYDVLVENESTALVVGEFGVIMVTRDAGYNWSILHQGDESLFNLTRAPNGWYWSMGQNGLLINSHNLEYTWETVDLSLQLELLDMYLDATGQGILLALGEVLFTEDGGMTWRPNSTLTLPFPWYQAVAVTTQGNYLLAGSFGSIVGIEREFSLVKH